MKIKLTDLLFNKNEIKQIAEQQSAQFEELLVEYIDELQKKIGN